MPKARILLIDDEDDLASIIEEGLQLFDFQVKAFTNPLDVLPVFKAGSYDIALIDVRMPQMDGFELAKKIKEMDDRIIVCFMTAFEKYKISEMHPGYDVEHFIRKPIKLAELAEKLGEMASAVQTSKP